MKKALRRFLSFSLLAILVFLSGLTTLLFFPQPLFAHHYDHGHFHVYFDGEIDQTTADHILDNAYGLIEKSELFDAKRYYDVFLSHGNIVDRLEDLQGKGPYARATAGNIFIKIPTQLDREHFPWGRNLVNLPELLAHELVHNLQAHRYGLWNFSPWKHPPYWKVEGYAEYISRVAIRNQKGYDLKKEVFKLKLEAEASPDGIVKITENYYAPLVYYKGRLMVEYLMLIEGRTYDQILQDKRTTDEVYAALCHWAE